MKALCIVLLLYCISAYAHRTPGGTLDNLNWEEGGSFRVTGISVNRIVEYGPNLVPYAFNRTALVQMESDAMLVLDVVNKRMFLDMGAGGQYYYFDSPPDGSPQGKSYIILNGACGVVSFNYSTQIREYSTPIHTRTMEDPDVGRVKMFVGENLDVGSCYETIAVSVGQDSHGIPRIWDWGHPWYLRPANPGPWFRSLISGYITFGDEPVRYRGSAPDAYFHLPPACAVPFPYCATLFPQRNVTYPGNVVFV